MSTIARALWNPIVAKEYRSRMRSWRSPLALMIYILMIGGLGWAIFAAMASSSANPYGGPAPNYGQTLFMYLVIFQMVLLAFVTPALTAGAISGERERQTLDVLLVSRVSAFGIVWGKLLASMAYILLLILTALPLFSAVFLFGGIDLQQFISSQVVTISTALCLGAMAVFFSALFQRSLAATVTSYASAFVLTIGTAIVSLVVGTSQTFSRAAAGGATNFQAAAEWYFNPFYALYNALFPNTATQVTLRGFLQLLIFGVQPAPNAPGPLLDPWFVCVVFEAILAAISVAGAVYLVRSRRLFRPRRLLEPAETLEAT